MFQVGDVVIWREMTTVKCVFLTMYRVNLDLGCRTAMLMVGNIENAMA